MSGDDLADGELIEAPDGESGSASPATAIRSRRGADGAGKVLEGGDTVFVCMGEVQNLRPFGQATARLARIGEERDGRFGAEPGSAPPP